MTVKAAEASGPTLTYAKMRGMVAILIGEAGSGDAAGWCAFFFFFNKTGRWLRDFFFYFNFFLTLLSFYFLAFMKQRRMGLNDFIQKIATNSYACKQ